jgi:hypothetical protein
LIFRRKRMRVTTLTAEQAARDATPPRSRRNRLSSLTDYSHTEIILLGRLSSLLWVR